MGLASGGVHASAVPSGFPLLTPPEPRGGDRVLCVAIAGSLVATGHAHGSVSLFDCGEGEEDGEGAYIIHRASEQDGLLPPWHFRAHTAAVSSLAMLDPFRRGVRGGKGLLLVTMSVAQVRLWSVGVTQPGAGTHATALRVGFLWELNRSTPSRGLAVHRGRLLWLR